MSRVAAGLVCLMAGLAGAACAADEPETIGRDAFVEAYAALRVAELRSRGAVISDQDRDRVLAEMGVVEDDLLAFAEAHGDDVPFMEALWRDVQRRVEEMGSESDEPA